MRRLAFLLVLLVGCKRSAPPSMWTEPVPTMEEPPVAALPPPSAEDCPDPAHTTPGEPSPYTDAAGRSTCRAQVVPPATIAELLEDQLQADFWKGRAVILQAGRESDRVYADERYRVVVEERDAAVKQVRVQRVAIVAGIVGGLLVGGGLTMGIMKLATRVVAPE